eukprot:TRINITY_DN7568_c0_g1_i18.p1 TRINITY_DN7568_c0_g1~~TRINITY_DN7568_c0_g1_i18.p1  ORF type:complete len:203 (+),score=47.88 TRINITY_DN7568_c0_g1_i18:237-845(+)
MAVRATMMAARQCHDGSQPVSWRQSASVMTTVSSAMKMIGLIFSWLGTDPKFSLYILCDKIFKKTLGFIPPGQELSDLSLRAKFVFVLTQFVFTIICMLMPMALVSSQTANSVWLCFLFMCCTWNGASFYIEVFSRRYAVKAFPPADSPRSKSSPRQPARQQVASSGVTRGLGAGQDPNPNPNPTQPASKAPAVSAADQKQD